MSVERSEQESVPTAGADVSRTAERWADMDAHGETRAPSWNLRAPRTADVVRLLASWFLTFLALLLTAEILPGFTYTSWWPLVVAAAVTGWSA